MSLKSKTASFPWKELTVAALVLLSLILMANLIDCIIHPMQYPGTTLVTVNSLSDHFPNGVPVFYSAIFVDEPVNFKERCELNLASTEEGEYKRRFEWYLTRENASFELKELTLGAYENVSNIIVNLNGRNVDCYVSEFNMTDFFPQSAIAGGQVHNYYWVKGFNLTEIDKMYWLEYTTKETLTLSSSRFIRTPWFFGENYGRYMYLPITNNFIEKNQTSGACIFDVNLGLDMQRIVPECSGWAQIFTIPLEDWDKYYNETTRLCNVPVVWYPLNQSYTIQDNHYTFTAYFSKENIASTIALVIVPDIRILAMFLVFLGAPFYIIGLYFIGKQLARGKRRKHVRSKGNKIYVLLTNPLSSVIQLYAVLLSITTLVFTASFWSAIGIVQKIAFPYAVVAAYPAVFFFAFKECIRKR